MANLNNAIINTASAAAQTIVTGVTGKQIKVYQMQLAGAAIITVQPMDGATAFTGTQTLAAGTPLVLPYTGVPWYVCSSGNSFVITTSNVQCSGNVLYEIT